MDAIREVIAEVVRLDREATPAPWDSLGEVCSFGYGKGGYNQCAGDPPDEEDARFILRSRTLLPRLAAALAVAVEEVESWPYEPRGAHGQLVMPHPRAEHVLRRIAAALAPEEPT